MSDYRDTLDPHADSAAQQRQIRALTSMAVSVDAGATYTYVLADANGYKRHSNADPVTAILAPNSSVAFPVGTKITIEQAGSGQVTITAGSGVTVNQPASLTLGLKEQWSTAVLMKVGPDGWTVAGDLSSSEEDTIPDNVLTLGGDYLTLGGEYLVLGA